MSYIFKEKISFKEYDNFIKKFKYLSYMQEEKWAKVKNIKNHKVIGVFDNDILCAVAHILVIEEKKAKRYFIPNGYLLEYKNIELLDFITQNVKELAKKEKIYLIDVYPNITNNNPYYTIAKNNLLNLNYKFTDVYIDKTDNILIPLKNDNKKIPKNILKKQYENKEFYTKRGIFFEISNSIDDIDRFEILLNKKYFNKELMKNLIKIFSDRVYMIFTKIDLNYYKNFLENTEDKYNEISKIEELLTISDEIDIGCALIIEPYNVKDNICEYIFNSELSSFEHLNIDNGMLYETMKICNKNDYDYIKVSNININILKYIEKYNGIPIKYIGKYSLIINKFKYYMHKPIRFKNK